MQTCKYIAFIQSLCAFRWAKIVLRSSYVGYKIHTTRDVKMSLESFYGPLVAPGGPWWSWGVPGGTPSNTSRGGPVPAGRNQAKRRSDRVLAKMRP